MGTKRIGRVGERDAGFHSNGALPSALSCCHYGSEVFRSCRKQSYGKTRLPWSISPLRPLPVSICSACWCNAIWASPMWLQAANFLCLFPSIVCLCPRNHNLNIHRPYLSLLTYSVIFFPGNSFFSCPFSSHLQRIVALLRLPFGLKRLQRNLFS